MIARCCGQSLVGDQSGAVLLTSSWSPNRLTSPKLPSSPGLLRQLAEHYFGNVHPLRCFAFVHKPSFMLQLDRGFDPDSDDNLALLHMICAHGSR